MPQQPQHEAQQFHAAIPIDRAGSRMPESSQNASLQGEDQIGKVGDIVSEFPGDFMSVHPSDFVGIRAPAETLNSKSIKHGDAHEYVRFCDRTHRDDSAE